MKQKNSKKLSEWMNHEEHPILSSLIMIAVSPILIPYVLFLLIKEA